VLEAEQLVRKALSGLSRILGDEDPSTITAMVDLNKVLNDQGKYEESESYGRRIIDINNRIRGEDHPETLVAMCNLIHVLWKAGKLEEAELVGRKALEGQRRVLGSEHFNTLSTMNNLAMAQNPKIRHPKKLAGVLPGLIVLLFILGLAGVIGPSLERTVKLEPNTIAEDQLDAIAAAFIDYCDELGEWPSVGEADRYMQAMHCAYITGFSCLRERPDSAQFWRGPYLRPSRTQFMAEQNPCVDPWMRGYRIYRFPANSPLGGENGTICAVSIGPNGNLDTPSAGIASGFASGDDLIRVISR